MAVPWRGACGAVAWWLLPLRAAWEAAMGAQLWKCLLQ